MRIKNFSDFLKGGRVIENSDADFSLNTWGEVGNSMQPPNSGFEGTSAEPMNYSAGYTGEEADEEPVIIDDEKEEKKEKKGPKISELKAMMEDLEERIKKLEPKEETQAASEESK